jgi:ribosomal protein L11 methyltransferase
MSQWNLLRLKVAPEHAEVCAQLLLDAGATGTQIDDQNLVLDESEDASFVPADEATITGYLEPSIDVESALSQLQSTLEQAHIVAQVESEAVDDTDWSTSWRENFPPLSIGKFLIVPSWENLENQADGQIVLQLDPGLAFGTGQHPTTRMCLELLGDYLPPQSTSDPTLLDVGCGSGILSLAAAKLGAQVTASDLDPWCVQATEENAAQNGVQLKVVEAAGAEWTQIHYDFVVANLMSDLLIMLAPQLAARCHAQSTLIISGISSPRADDVEHAMQSAGFQTVEKREQDGESRGDYTERWAAFVFNRQPAAAVGSGG